MAGSCHHDPKKRTTRTSAGASRPSKEKNEMPAKIIVSYDGTANEDDAVALGRLLG